VSCLGQSPATEKLASYLGIVLEVPVIAPSALKHGISEEEILHASLR
jgi:alkylhydroperoxidase/carboxymuconolactone decarboxylase family protein YurZ